MPTAELKQPQAPAKRLDVKQAAKLALEYFKELYSIGPFMDVALEEVEMSDDGGYWMITLGFDAPKSSKTASPLADALGPRFVRKFKIFKVDARTGKVVSMRIRKLE